jgi:hypothetical protein
MVFTDQPKKRAALLRFFLFGISLFVLSRPATALYRNPILKLQPLDNAALGSMNGLVLEDSSRGDSVRAVAKLSAPPSFQAGSGVAISCNVTVTFSSARGGAATAKLVHRWSGLAMLRTPDSDKYGTSDIVDIKEVVIPPGGTATVTLAAGVQFASVSGWNPEDRSVIYRPVPTAGHWDTRYGGPANPDYKPFLHTYSEGRVGLSGGFDLDVGVGSASRIDHLNYNYEGKSDYYEGTVAPPPPPPAPPVVKPKPQPPAPKPVINENTEELDRLLKLKGKIALMEKRLEQAGVELQLKARAIADLREQIRILQNAAEDPTFFAEARAEAKSKLPELRKQRDELLAAQDKLIAQVSLEYQELALQTGLALDKSTTPEIKAELQAIKAVIDDKAEVLPVELYLASGQRDKFIAKAQDLIARNIQPAVVYRLRAADYINNGDPRAALYALRKSLAIDPEDRTGRAMLQGVELGYLRGIADKTLGDAADIKAKFDEAVSAHGDAGGLNYLKDLLTMGITTSVSAIGGKPGSLADFTVSAMDEASVEHSGLLIIIALRRAGYTLDQIQNMSTEGLAKNLKEVYGAKTDDLEALRMRKAMAMAFQNADVKRLLAPTREQFDIDRGKSFFATDAFEPTWQDQMGNAASISNVLMLFGPSAIVSSGGKLATIGRMSAQQVAEATTLGEAFSSALKMEEMAQILGQTAAGKAALKELTRFEQNTGIVSKVLAQLIIQEGMIQAGGRLGGKPGEIIAEILASFGAGDLEGAARLLRKRAVPADRVERLVNEMRYAAEATAAARLSSTGYLQKLDKALLEMKGGKLSATTAADLRKSAEEVEARAKTTLQKVADQRTDSTLALEAQKQETLAQTLKTAADGKPAKTQKILDYLKKLEQQSGEKSGEATKTLTTLQQIGEKLKTGQLPITAPPGKPKVLKALTPTAVAGKAAADGEDAFLRRNWKLARQRYQAALELGKNLSEEEVAFLRARIQLIKEIEQVGKEQATRATTATNRLSNQDFGNKEIAALQAVPLDKMKPLKNSVGGGSFTDPKLILDASGRPIAVFKPASLPGAMDLDGEVAAYEFGKLLGLDVPAVTRITVTGPGGKKIDGIAVRYIQGSDFITAGPAEFLAAKRDIALDKAFSTFIGDHDRHMGNYFRTADGKVLSIDHGMADLAEIPAQGAAPGKFESLVTERMENRIKGVGEVHDQIGALEGNMVFQDMGDMVSRIEKLSDEQMRGVLAKVYGSGPGAEQKIAQALEALKIRQQQLRPLMKKYFPPLPSAVKSKAALPDWGPAFATIFGPEKIRPAALLQAA